MPIIVNQPLYDEVKKDADAKYEKHSAYKSMWIQREYKKRGGTFKDDGKERKLERWKNENWQDINPSKTDTSYPVFRPTKRITKDTPLLASEIDPKNLKEQIQKKLKIKGESNLKPFNPRIPRKKGQPAKSKQHSDLYTDEDPVGTIQGLKFATIADAKRSIEIIKSSDTTLNHKIQASVAMEQRARVAGKKGSADVYRKYIDANKKGGNIHMDEKEPEKEEAEVDDLKPPFCRQGNKFPLRNRIIPLFPPHTTYVEPFAGSSAIFFNKPKAKKNVLNDLDKDTIKRYRLLKRASKDKSKYRQDLTTLKAIRYFFDHHTDSDADQLFFEKIKACMGFSGLPAKKSKGVYKNTNPIKMLDLIDEYQDKLKGVILTNEDYAKVIKQYDSPTTLFFIDPPYEESDKSLGYAESEGFDFERLVETLKGIKGNFLMTINDSPRVRKLFSDFTQKPVDVKTSWGNMKQSVKGAVRKELFISNYTMGRIPSY